MTTNTTPPLSDAEEAKIRAEAFAGDDTALWRNRTALRFIATLDESRTQHAETKRELAALKEASRQVLAYLLHGTMSHSEAIQCLRAVLPQATGEGEAS